MWPVPMNPTTGGEFVTSVTLVVDGVGEMKQPGGSQCCHYGHRAVPSACYEAISASLRPSLQPSLVLPSWRSSLQLSS